MECINSPKVTASNLITSAMRAVNPTVDHSSGEARGSAAVLRVRNSISARRCRPQTFMSGDGRDLASLPKAARRLPGSYCGLPGPLSNAARLCHLHSRGHKEGSLLVTD